MGPGPGKQAQCMRRLPRGFPDYTLQEHVGKGREAAGSTCCVQCPLTHLCVCPTPATMMPSAQEGPQSPAAGPTTITPQASRVFTQVCFSVRTPDAVKECLAKLSWSAFREESLEFPSWSLSSHPFCSWFLPGLKAKAVILFSLYFSFLSFCFLFLFSFTSFLFSVPIFPERVRFFATRPHGILCDPADGYCGMDVKCPSPAHVLVHLAPVWWCPFGRLWNL